MNFNTLVQIAEGSYYGIPMHQQIAGGRRTADNAATANLGLGLTSGSSATNRAYTPSEAEETLRPSELIDGIISIIDKRIDNIKQSQPDMKYAIQQLEALRSDVQSMH